MLETTDGPLNTSAEYNCKRDAPEITASHAELLESIPPTPTMGNFPLVSSNVWLITSSALECNGLPDSPPSLENAFRAFVPQGIGRLMVVLVATNPFIPRSIDVLITSEICSSVESGESLRRIGFSTSFFARISLHADRI